MTWSVPFNRSSTFYCVRDIRVIVAQEHRRFGYESYDVNINRTPTLGTHLGTHREIKSDRPFAFFFT